MTTVRQLTYQPADVTAVGVEVLSFDRLRQVNHGWTQRGDFHVPAFVDDGHGRVTVDFGIYPLRSGTAVSVRPGAVHRWDDIAAVEGTSVLFVPTAPVTHATRQLAANPHIRPVWTVATADLAHVRAARAHLELETCPHPATTSHELPRILLSALPVRSDPPRTVQPTASRTFELFQASVEQHFRVHHDLGFYARTLGYAPRTPTRAALQTTGRTAKMYLTDRLVLEAQRLLVHDRLPAARVAAELGFADASNFSIFFRTATGTPPVTWQRQHADSLR